MKKLLLCISTALLAMLAGCSDDIADDVIGEIEDVYGEVLLNGKNIAGVWAVVEDESNSDYFDYFIKELCVIDSETINYHNSIPLNGYGNNGYGFTGGYLYDCTLENYEFDSSALFSVMGNKAYVAGFYTCELELQDETLTFLYDNSSRILKKVRGFKKQDFPSSGETDNTGLPIPLDNEIYYRTSNGEPINVSFSDFYSNTYDREKNYGRIVSLYPITMIGGGCFRGCSTLTHITIPDSVTSIGSSAFSGCESLTSITVPNSITSIGEYAFEDCGSLTSITVPESVTFIGNGAFSGCAGELIIDNKIVEADYSPSKSLMDTWFNNSYFTSVVIGENVTSIGDGAFYYCTRLKSIIIPDSVTSIGEYAFENCTRLESIIIPDSVTSIGSRAFSDCESLASIIIPDSVTSIGSSAFSDCESLASITIPDSVTSIGNYAFDSCKSLRSITIPDSVTSIGEGAFTYCKSLVSVTIPNSVTLIGGKAFYHCSSLVSITIPNSVTVIEYGAFSGCSSLTSVYCKPTTPPAIAFSGVFPYNSGMKIYVPQNSYGAYTRYSTVWHEEPSVKNWSKYKEYIEPYDFE